MFEQHFSVRVMAEKYIRIYQHVIATSLSKLPKIAAGTSTRAYSSAPSLVEKVEPTIQTRTTRNVIQKQN